MGNIAVGIIIAVIVVGIVAWMIKNVRNGKSFCGADLTEPLNTTENLTQNKKWG
ncbi:MAG: hypothetical protein NC433_13980 [Clostridiales bacterium]|nr:hypothetical protein [Clostridiales bacterium]